jgi:hypothetical protein
MKSPLEGRPDALEEPPASGCYYFCVSKRRDEIDEELRRLRTYEDHFTDPQTVAAIKALITDLEAEKAALPPDEK